MPIFNNFRNNEIQIKGIKRYLIYAIGEIALVVIGILIAMEINNWSEAKKAREKELIYLENIRHDLLATSAELKRFIVLRKKIGTAAEKIVSHFEGEPITDWKTFNANLVTVYEWSRFYPIDNTFREMSSSGNLSLISNDSIKNGLLELDQLYMRLKNTEDHFRYDTEKCLYESIYTYGDIKKMVDSYYPRDSDKNLGISVKLEKSDFEMILKDIRQKNGFVFATLYMPGITVSCENLKASCKLLISLIDREMKK